MRGRPLGGRPLSGRPLSGYGLGQRRRAGGGSGGGAFDPLSLSPLAYWPLDDGSGATAADLSGNGYDFTLANTPEWLVGGGLRFAAASSEKGETTAAALLGALEDLDAYTVSFWARAAAYSSDPAALGIDNGGSGTASFILYPYDSVNGNGFRSYLHAGVGDVGVDQNTGAASLDVYNHFMFVQRSTTDREMYVNNVSVGTSAGSANLPATLTSVTIGAWNGGQFATVDMRHVVLVGRAATAAERAALAGFNP
jgi:hypothetical protein